MSKQENDLNENLSFEQRAKDLVSKMTLEEKMSQMLHSAPAVERLGIPAYNWWNEALHGVARAGVATVFPQAIGVAATFDEDLIFHTADIISTEGRAKYHESARKGDRGIYKGLTFWSPNVNIFRDPRWGRGHETYGEDPYLTGRLGVAFIKGIQGNDSKYMKAAACAKHFAVHSGPEGERHSFDAVVSAKDLRETYLPAFRDCVMEGQAEAVMGAYNRTNGEPCCGSETLLENILRREWSFKGHVVSDCWALRDFHEHHKVTSTPAESAALAVKNGCDLNCGCVFNHLIDAFHEGLVTEEQIDKAVVRLMMTRMKLGMFDRDELVPYAGIPYEVNDSKAHNEAALEVAKKSLVLLKNENNMLPLDKKQIRSIAVIGPNANSREALIGNYYGTASKYVTVLEGIRSAVGDDTRVYYAQGCHLFNKKTEGLGEEGDRIAEAVSAAERADVVVMCLGLDATIEGEQGDASNTDASGDKIDLNLPGLQQELLEKVYSVNKNVALVLLAGSALAVSWADEHIPAVVQAWYPGAQGGHAVASLLFGEYSPSGRLPVTFYRTSEELPDFRDYAMANRTYRYMTQEALYPFGFGLSYSKFQYEDLRIDKEQLDAGESLACSVTVKNFGERAAEETVQLYLKDIEATVPLPKWQLTGVRKVTLQPGEAQQVAFTVSAKQMALINYEGKRVLEPGRFEIFAGGSQPDERSIKLNQSDVLKGSFEVSGSPLELEY